MMDGFTVFLIGVDGILVVFVVILGTTVVRERRARELWVREAERQSAAAAQAERALSTLFDRYRELASDRMRDESKIPTIPRIVPAVRAKRKSGNP